jgi:iron complex outermembrane receptor protein
VLAYTVTELSPYGAAPGSNYTNQLDHVSLDPNPIFTDQMLETTLKVRWASDFGTVTSHTAYTDEKPGFDNDYDGTYFDLQRIPAIFLRHTFYQSLDYDVKPFPTLEVQAGGMYFSDESSNNATADLGPATFPPFTAPLGLPYVFLQQTLVTMQTTAYAGYVDATWEAIPHLFVNAGVRYSDDKRTVFGYYISNAFLAPPYPPYAPRTTKSFPATTPSATIRYQFAPRSDVYFSYTKGFKSGTFNTVATTPATITAPVQPEHITAYEVGLKTARGPFHLETAAYYYDYRNLQVNELTTDPNTLRVLNILANAATARIWGWEGSGGWAVTSNLNLRASVAYTHARYVSFPAAAVSLPLGGAVVTSVPAGGFPGLPGELPGAGLTENFSNKRIARAPDWTVSVGGDYTIPLSVGKMVLAANGYYTSAYAPLAIDFNPTTGKPYYYDNGYFLANASVDYTRDHYTVGAYVNNIGDTRFDILNQADNFGVKKVQSSPRTYGVRISYSY